MQRDTRESEVYHFRPRSSIAEKGELIVTNENTEKLSDDEMNAILADLTPKQWAAILQFFAIEKVLAFLDQEAEQAKKLREDWEWIRARLLEARDRRHPEREKHRRWQKWKNDGLSFNDIVLKHKDETGEDITRDAVFIALKRLKKEEEK